MVAGVLGTHKIAFDVWGDLPHQVQIDLQVLTAMIDFGLDPQQAAEMPRWT
jgi:hypothetical protein